MQNSKTIPRKPKTIKEIKSILRSSDIIKVLEGIYQNYVNVPYYDDDMLKTSEFLNYLSLSDILHQNSLKYQAFSLQTFLYVIECLFSF